MGVRGFSSFIDQLVVGNFHRGSRSDHSVCQDQGLAGQAGAGAVFDGYVELINLIILPVSGNESALGIVENVHDALVDRQSGPKDCGGDNLGVGSLDAGRRQGCLDFFRRIFQSLTDLVSEYLTDPFEIETEAETVFLDLPVADLRDNIAQSRVAFTEVNDFHFVMREWLLKSKIAIYFNSSKFFSLRLLKWSDDVNPVV